MSVFSQLYAVLTEQTCGEACWHARELVCRCSCGGANHGALRSKDGVQPVRMSKIDGIPYKLLAVGPYRDVRGEANALCDNWGPKKEPAVVRHEDGGVGNLYVYWYDVTDKGAPARLKRATPQQLAKWPELAAYKNELPFKEISLVWIRDDFTMQGREPMPYAKWLTIGQHLWMREKGLQFSYSDIKAEGQEALKKYDAGWRWEDGARPAPDSREARMEAMKKESWYVDEEEAA